MVQNDNAEWEAFEAQLDEVVEDTSESAQNGQSDASHDSQTNAQAQDELQSACSYEDDNDLEEVNVDEFAIQPQAEMEAESGATAEQHDPTQETLATGPVVAEAPVELSSGSSSTATIRSAEPQSEAAANRARVTERGYLARRRAMRKSASVQTAKDETSTKKKAASRSQHAGARTRSAPAQGQQIATARIPNATTTLPSTPSPAAAALPPPQTGTQPSAAPAPTSVSTPSASSSSALTIPTPSSSHAATSPATLPPPPPLPVGPTGRRQLWEGELKLGLPHLKAGYRIALPPARPASAPVVGAASAGPVLQVGARHQSAPVASTSRGKRSRDEEDRGERVVRKRAKANNSTVPSQRQERASSSISAARPQWIPYSAQQPGKSGQREHLSASQPSRLPAQTQQQDVSSRHEQQMHHFTPPPLAASPSTSTSQRAMEMSSTARYINVPGRQAPYTVTPQRSFERPMQPIPVAGPSRRPYEQEQGDSSLQHLRSRPVNAQTHAMPQAAVPRTFARAKSSTSRGAGQSIVPQQPLQATPEAGPSRAAYQQPYNRAGVQRLYDQPASPQSYMTPVPSGWNDPAAVPRTFARAQSSVSTMQMEGQSTYRRVQDAPVAYTAQPQQQMGRPALSMYGEPGAEQRPSVAIGSQLVYNQPYAPSPPMPAGWNPSAQRQVMSSGETVPSYLTMYAPPNHPPPGWNPQVQAPVYEPHPSAQSFSSGQGSMSSAYGYGYDF